MAGLLGSYLEIPMHDPFGVEVGDPSAHVSKEFLDLLGGNFLFVELLE